MASYLRAYLPESPEFYFGQGFFDPREGIIKNAAECDIAAISSTTPVFPEATRIAEGIKRLNPDTKTVLGGYQASAMPEWCGKWACWDHIVVGEGEEALLRIVKGEQARYIISQNVTPLDRIPPPNRRIIKNERTIALTEKNDHERITSILTQRGCPFDCVFCCDGSGSLREIEGVGRVGHSMWGRAMRYHSVERVVQEICMTIMDWRLDLLKFSDMTTNSNKERLKEICRQIIKQGGVGNAELGSNMHASHTLVDAELLNLMKKAGWREVWFGVECATNRLQATIGKRLSVEDVKRAFKLAKEAGLKTRAYFQIGHWQETEEDIREIPKLVNEIQPDIFGCTVTCPYPGTQTWLELTPEEREKALDWDYLSQLDEYSNPIRHTPNFTNEQLKQWQEWLSKEIPQETSLSWRMKGLEGRQKDFKYMEA